MHARHMPSKKVAVWVNIVCTFWIQAMQGHLVMYRPATLTCSSDYMIGAAPCHWSHRNLAAVGSTILSELLHL